MPIFDPPLLARVIITLAISTPKTETILLGTLKDPDGDNFSTELTSNPTLDFISVELSPSGDWTLKVDYDPSRSQNSDL